MWVCAVLCVSSGDKKTKRRRSSELSPTCKSTAPPRLTERQQLALLLQMTAEKRGLFVTDFIMLHITCGGAVA